MVSGKFKYNGQNKMNKRERFAAQVYHKHHLFIIIKKIKYKIKIISTILKVKNNLNHQPGPVLSTCRHRSRKSNSFSSGQTFGSCVMIGWVMAQCTKYVESKSITNNL
jgi:hypothetical protein